jgi:hypothetical protein
MVPVSFERPIPAVLRAKKGETFENCSMFLGRRPKKKLRSGCLSGPRGAKSQGGVPSECAVIHPPPLSPLALLTAGVAALRHEWRSTVAAAAWQCAAAATGTHSTTHGSGSGGGTWMATRPRGRTEPLRCPLLPHRECAPLSCCWIRIRRWISRCWDTLCSGPLHASFCRTTLSEAPRHRVVIAPLKWSAAAAAVHAVAAHRHCGPTPLAGLHCSGHSSC